MISNTDVFEAPSLHGGVFRWRVGVGVIPEVLRMQKAAAGGGGKGSGGASSRGQISMHYFPFIALFTSSTHFNTFLP